MANLFVLLSKGNASSERIYSLLSIEPKIISGLKAFDKESQVTVEFQNVFLNYTNSNDDELENITFTLNKGEIIVIPEKTVLTLSDFIINSERTLEWEGEKIQYK